MAFNIWKTLRFRLAMWNAGAVALTAAMTILAVHQATRWALVHSLDMLLAEDAEEIRLALQDLDFDDPDLRDELSRKATGHRRHEWYVRLWSDDKQELWSSLESPSEREIPVDRRAGRYATDGTFRVFVLAVQDVSPVRWIQIGASIEPLTQELERIDRIAWLTWLLSLVIAPALGWWLSGHALSPLRTMVHTAANLRPNRLSDRLPTRGADDELDQLAATINSLLDRIAKDVGEKHDFLSDAAHELRTPLAAIRATADVALVSQRSGEEYRELVAQILEQTDGLSAIVNQLLLLAESTIPPRSETRRSFALNELITKSVDIFRVVAEGNGISLRIDRNDSVQMTGSREQWLQVLNNLIDNAIKYTSSGGRVSIDLRLLSGEGSQPHAQLAVSDTGIGIRASDLPRIFDRFYRADRSRTRLNDVSGTGLGLSICGAVVESHGGTIRCVSQPGLGSTFTIDLPLQS